MTAYFVEPDKSSPDLRTHVGPCVAAPIRPPGARISDVYAFNKDATVFWIGGSRDLNPNAYIHQADDGHLTVRNCTIAPASWGRRYCAVLRIVCWHWWPWKVLARFGRWANFK